MASESDRVGEERLLEVADVVDHDVGAALAVLVRQLADVVGEAEHPGERGGEAELGAGSDVVRDLQHRPALVDGALVALQVLDHHDGWELRRLPGRAGHRRRRPAAAWIVSGSPVAVMVASS